MDVDSQEGWDYENRLLLALRDKACPPLAQLVDFFRDEATGHPCIVMPR